MSNLCSRAKSCASTFGSRAGPGASTRRWLAWLVVLALVCGGSVWLQRRLVCAGLFLRMEGAKDYPAWLLHFGEYTVTTRAFALPSGAQGILYEPQGVGAAAGLVLAHGIHEEGIHEQRLVAFARALASSGIVVYTPELVDLAHYRVTHAGAETIAEAARAMAQRLDEPAVTVFGISFGGGLALRAACEPALRGAIAKVIGLGAHHDAGVVSRFFLGDPARAPDGSVAELKPHGYGASVLFASLFGEKHRGPITEPERQRLREALSGRGRELADASPVKCPGPVVVPVHLAHGLGDRIIPFTETLWNARQFGAQTHVETLISSALVHAEYTAPGLWERFELIDFMAEAMP